MRGAIQQVYYKKGYLWDLQCWRVTVNSVNDTKKKRDKGDKKETQERCKLILDMISYGYGYVSDKSVVLEKSWGKVTGTKTISAKLILKAMEGVASRKQVALKPSGEKSNK